MTKRYSHGTDMSFHLELVTEDDDLLSKDGDAKWRACLRSADPTRIACSLLDHAPADPRVTG
jgi:hypothetical protein